MNFFRRKGRVSASRAGSGRGAASGGTGFPFGLLWLVYFAANLGRLSYSSCLVDIVDRGGLSRASASLVITGFYICYGLGQIAAGYIGGLVSPAGLIFTGLFCTALANLAMCFATTGTLMLVIWCFNGLIQAIIWPPVLRIIVERYDEPKRSKVCVDISTTYPIAVMCACVSCAAIITVLSWRAVFFVYAVLLFCVSGVWAAAYRGVSGTEQREPAGARSPRNTPEKTGVKKESGFFAPGNGPGIAIVFFCLALISQGALRDGLMTWIPVYTAGVFSLPSNTAILSAGIIPLINLAGIYLCRFLFRRAMDEGKISMYLFGASALAALMLRLLGDYHIALSLFAFAAITACMMGINLMLVTFVPARFSKIGLTPFLTGLTNSMVYVGSSASSFGIALVIEKAGWQGLQTLFLLLAVISVLFCALARPRWAVFTKSLRGKNPPRR